MVKKIRCLMVGMCCFWFGLCQAKAQDTVPLPRILAEIKKAQDRFATGAFTFKVQYKYANETDPTQYLDSLSGRVQVAAGNYVTELDSTTTIQNSRYAIILFKEDKLMYITKTAPKLGGSTPGQLIDSAVLKLKGLKGNLIAHTDGKGQTVVLYFPPAASYKKAILRLNADGFVTETNLVVKSALMMPNPYPEQEATNKDGYAIIEARFSDLQPLLPGEMHTSEDHYFTQQGNEIIPTPAYKDYKIFLGSPNL